MDGTLRTSSTIHSTRSEGTRSHSQRLRPISTACFEISIWTVRRCGYRTWRNSAWRPLPAPKSALTVSGPIHGLGLEDRAETAGVVPVAAGLVQLPSLVRGIGGLVHVEVGVELEKRVLELFSRRPS